MMNSCMIQIRNLTKSYKDLEVLRGINLEIERGSVFALLGPNGAGKTTTIKILSTLIKPDSGTARLAGCDILTDPRGVRRNISLTGQYAAIDELLTGRENLKMIGDLLRIRERKVKINDLIKRFDLSDAADRRVSTYSGGMKRKIDIAMSLIGDPTILFLDEPTTGLDPQSRKSMWKTIKGLSDSGVTVFLTTQYFEEAEHLADRISILNKGRIIADGTPDELKKIVPGEIIELELHNRETAEKVIEVLEAYEPIRINANGTVRLESSADVSEMRDIFSRLDRASVEIVSFEKKKASLEDVFLRIIGADEEAVDE